MARRGGYSRSQDGIEWAKVAEQLDAEGKLSAAGMGQTYFVWLNDAITHHVYRCEMLQAQERYLADELDAGTNRRPTPDRHDMRYQVTRPKPTITRPQAGQGTAPGNRSYRP